jgi:predicted transcriptional regulator
VTKAQIVEAMERNGTTSLDLQSLTGLSRSAVSRALRDMHAEGAIKKIGEIRNVKGGPSIAKWGLV